MRHWDSARLLGETIATNTPICGDCRGMSGVARQISRLIYHRRLHSTTTAKHLDVYLCSLPQISLNRNRAKMPLPGGATDKYGNRYEGRWTVSCIFQILNGSADTICLEPVGSDGKGVEFWLRRNAGVEFHQVKRQNSDGGKWTIADLKALRVLENFKEKLSLAPEHRCVFVSTHAVHPLDELINRARNADSVAEFETNYLTGKALREAYASLCSIWDVNSQAAYDFLSRIEVHTISEQLLRNMINEQAARSYLTSENVPDVLAHFALDNIHQKLTASTISEHLESRGFQRAPAARQHDVEMINFFRRCFDRPAFRDRFTRERSAENFIQAVEHTLLALNTGDYFSRDGKRLSPGLPKSELANTRWFDVMEDITLRLEEILTRYRDAADRHRRITGRNPDDVELRFADGGQLADYIDERRRHIVREFSDICSEAGLRRLRELK